ncbi:hypothetical protein [Telmatospirillum siberiense]|uniref:Uncharacterized protein n=1 Tax=Telmatospirillum siberiense TaxID=382514 RepID=A0A2N3PRW3_9PROT|nr:hypothetical protein [Telmatospirillum siberiense]PKU23124.1 hypothetical protein CWS72_18010 [Telmatospirillum siberiense]
MAFASAIASPIDFFVTTTVARGAALVKKPRRLVRRWTVDSATGRLVCAWESDPDSRRPIPHLRLVRI